MKKLAFILALLCSSPAWATWTCKDGATGCTSTTVRKCSTTLATCNITVAATTAHSVEVLLMTSASLTVTLTGSGDGTWATATASHGSHSGSGGVEFAYNLNSTGGATTITCNFSGSATTDCTFFEFTSSLGTITYDSTAGGATSSASCATCAGVAYTLSTANNYVFIQGGASDNTISAISATYTFVNTTNSNGMAFKLNQTTAGTTPNWTSTGTNYTGGAIAIYETSGGGAATCKPTLSTLGVSSCG